MNVYIVGFSHCAEMPVCETGYKRYNREPHALKVNITIIKYKESIANAFNKYFPTIASTTTIGCNKDNSESRRNINPLYYLNQSYISPLKISDGIRPQLQELKK
jgi:hypothetical protein